TRRPCSGSATPTSRRPASGRAARPPPRRLTSGHDDGERGCQDLDLDRREAGRVAVELDRYQRPADDPEVAGAAVADVRPSEMRGAQYRQRVARQRQAARPLEDDPVEQAVVRPGVCRHWEGAGVGREVEHEAVGAARPDAVGPDLDRTRGQAPERPEDRQEVPPPADRAEGPGPAAPARDAMGDLRIEPDPDHQAEEPPAGPP